MSERVNMSDRVPVGRALAIVLGLLTVFGPISMDLYLPVLPDLTRELGAATSTAQLTITACLLGLAGGQVIAGPLSDRLGRRRPLLVGVVLYIATSLLCGLAGSVGVLIAARFAQGLAGAVGIVIAQAAGRDVYSGPALVRYYGRLTVLGGLAAIVGPVIGGQLALVTDWRGVFVFLAVIGVVILLASAQVFTETLPTAQRHTGGLGQSGRDFHRLLHDRTVVGAVLVTGSLGAALFAYLAGATFVLQGIYGLSAQQYSLAFGLNSLGFMTAGFVAGRLTERVGERAVMAAGLAMCLLGAVGLLLTALLSLPLVAVIASLVVMVSGVAVTSPPATAMAMAGHPDIAGTAAALLGVARFAFGGVAAPLVGLRGGDDALPLGVIPFVSTFAATLIFILVLPRRLSSPTRPLARPLDPLIAPPATTPTPTPTPTPTAATRAHRCACKRRHPAPAFLRRTTMQYAHLGRSGVQVSRIGLGTMNFAMEIDEQDSRAVLDAAFDAGITYVDTADVYGGPQSPDMTQGYGTSEEYLGRWLARDGHRDQVVLATKVYQPMGTGPNDRGLSALHIRKACEDSLRRLQTDHIDLYQMHHIDRATPWEEIWQAMEQLVREGKIIYVGSSNFAGWDIATAQQIAAHRNFTGLVSEQSLYNLSARTIELEVIPALRHYGLGLVPWSPLGGGLLAGALNAGGKGRRGAERIQAQVEQRRASVQAYENLCRELGEQPADVALAWLLHQPAVSATIVGPRSADQLTSSLRALEVSLPQEVLERLDEIWPGPGGEAPAAYAW